VSAPKAPVARISLTSEAASVPAFPNGGGAAAVLAAGIGAFLMALIALLADKSPAIKSAMIFYKPTGPLSGVTTCAIFLWLVAWFVLHARWKNRNVAMGCAGTVALVLLVLAVLLTFPPIGDLF
jgi:hypothetical protein